MEKTGEVWDWVVGDRAGRMVSERQVVMWRQSGRRTRMSG